MNDKGPCLTPEVIAAYLDGFRGQGSLSVAERQAVEWHLARCETCIAAVASTIRTLIETRGD